MSVSNRVRRPDLIKPYVEPPRPNVDELPPDFLATFSLIMGLTGMMMKIKWASWLSLLACVGSFCTVKRSEIDLKHMMCSFSFAIMGLANTYGRNRPAPMGVGEALTKMLPSGLLSQIGLG
mmetsp:Transcript_18733/g.45087  ORF Transcript_18733/g.45087 Transcript_18733/m.45087 type:complete len:121 (+) Transcript_18733:145-507(+)|eukprot:CAMPEP_0180136296 /NCGR_PEP_ID=MMETSP0986-20121125/11414_1 /TAXON_ID=697907 /ORGANISM="non described non described, Strain CCMP2293" /LENGTH=120 /DNA_ID=CAMNT_0022077303 /DNA_START=145 /DNA_END=507 /DNA_ORIENTATION=+